MIWNVDLPLFCIALRHQGWVFGSPIKLTQNKRKFPFEFCNFEVKFSVYIVWRLVLRFNSLILHKNINSKRIFIQKEFTLWNNLVQMKARVLLTSPLCSVRILKLS